MSMDFHTASLGSWALNPIFLKEILVYERSGSATPTRAAVVALDTGRGGGCEEAAHSPIVDAIWVG